MDFDQLATFVYVAKLKSFSRAGQKVFRSQSAVSAQIRQLEQAYRAKLLDRSAKSVELTPAGEVLFEYAERLLRLRDESLQGVADRGNVVQGTVLFGANEATCLYLLPDIFAEFQRRYPLVHISIYRNFSHKILQRIEDGTIDVGIVTLPIKAFNTKVHHIYRDRLRFMVSTRNPLANRIENYFGRSGRAAVDFSTHGVYAAGAGQTFPAVSLTAAHHHGIAKHRHDQAICGRRCGGFFHQRKFCQRSSESRGSEAAERRRRGSVAGIRVWFTGAIGACRARRNR